MPNNQAKKTKQKNFINKNKDKDKNNGYHKLDYHRRPDQHRDRRLYV